MAAAVLSGNVELVKWVLVTAGKLVSEAATTVRFATGGLELFKWYDRYGAALVESIRKNRNIDQVKEREPKFNRYNGSKLLHTIASAAHAKSLDLVRYLLQTNHPHSITTKVWTNYLNIVCALVELDDIPVLAAMVCRMPLSEDLSVYETQLRKCKSIEMKRSIVAAAVWKSNDRILQWALDHRFPIPPHATALAAKGGDLELVKRLVEEYHAPFDSQLFEVAVIAQSLPLLDYLTTLDLKDKQHAQWKAWSVKMALVQTNNVDLLVKLEPLVQTVATASQTSVLDIALKEKAWKVYEYLHTCGKARLIFSYNRPFYYMDLERIQVALKYNDLVIDIPQNQHHPHLDTNMVSLFWIHSVAVETDDPEMMAWIIATIPGTDEFAMPPLKTPTYSLELAPECLTWLFKTYPNKAWNSRFRGFVQQQLFAALSKTDLRVLRILRRNLTPDEIVHMVSTMQLGPRKSFTAPYAFTSYVREWWSGVEGAWERYGQHF